MPFYLLLSLFLLGGAAATQKDIERAVFQEVIPFFYQKKTRKPNLKEPSEGDVLQEEAQEDARSLKGQQKNGARQKTKRVKRPLRLVGQAKRERQVVYGKRYKRKTVKGAAWERGAAGFLPEKSMGIKDWEIPLRPLSPNVQKNIVSLQAPLPPPPDIHKPCPGIFWDISLQEPIQVAAKRARTFDTTVWLLSYAGGADVNYQNQNFMHFSGINKGIDGHLRWQESDLQNDFWLNDAALRPNHTDQFAVVWSILKTLDILPANDIFVYTGGGWIIEREITPLVNMLKNQELLYCPKGVDGIHDILLVKNTPSVKRVLRSWMNHFLTEPDSQGPQELTGLSSLLEQEAGRRQEFEESAFPHKKWMDPAPLFAKTLSAQTLLSYFTPHGRTQAGSSIVDILLGNKDFMARHTKPSLFMPAEDDLSLLPVHKRNPNNKPMWVINYAHPRKVHRDYSMAWKANNSIDNQNQNYQNYSVFKHTAALGIRNYLRDDLDRTFVQRNRHILDVPRGGGLWLWKPWIVNHALKMLPEGSQLCYSDVGTAATQNLESLLKPDCDFMYPFGGYINRMSFRMDTLWMAHIPYNQWEACLNAEHPWTGALVMNNLDVVSAFVEEYLSISAGIRILSDIPSLTNIKNPHLCLSAPEENTLYIAWWYNQKSVKPLRFNKESGLFFDSELWWHHRRTPYASLFDLPQAVARDRLRPV